MRLSVIVPVHNGGAAFKRALAALAASERVPDELIVVDDGSKDDSAEAARATGARLVTLTGGPAGPATARNEGAAIAQGEALVFIDADAAVHPDTLGRMEDCLRSNGDVAALFGSYDDAPPERNWPSLYMNLRHHYVHQRGCREATTFWAGCGAIRRQVFASVGGFDARYGRPQIEDVELGLRLRRSGQRVLLCPEVQVTHLKRWGLVSAIRGDIRDRAIPWTRLILRERYLPAALNLDWRSRWSAAFAWATVGFVSLAWLGPLFVLGAGAMALALLWLNLGLCRLFARQGGLAFAVGGFGLHLLHFLYSSMVFAALTLLHLLRGGRQDASVLPRGSA